MDGDPDFWRFSPADRLELVAFDLALRRAPRALIQTVWDGLNALENMFPSSELRPGVATGAFATSSARGSESHRRLQILADLFEERRDLR